jgi:hypothetical protein
MNPVVHFEIPAKDRKRMADFYTQVFGWRTQMLGPEMGAGFPSLLLMRAHLHNRQRLQHCHSVAFRVTNGHI